MPGACRPDYWSNGCTKAGRRGDCADRWAAIDKRVTSVLPSSKQSGFMETALRMTASYPRIPYGEMSFPRIRRNGWLYVDKTRYLRPLEEERYAFFIRPRRFGKSCWLTLLECYYGRHWAGEFEGLFGGTDVGRARPNTVLAHRGGRPMSPLPTAAASTATSSPP